LKRLLVLVIACATLGVLAHQNEERRPQLDRLAPLIGEWDVTLTVDIPELSGPQRGTMKATWALDKTYVQLDARLDSQAKLQGVGYVTFDDNATYERRKYRAYLIWSYDGGCLPLEGTFSDKTLAMTGRVITMSSERLDTKVQTVFRDKDHIDVTVLALVSGSEPPAYARYATLQFVRRN
jgi:hypothetical protein